MDNPDHLLNPLDMPVKDLIQTAIDMNAGITRLNLNDGNGNAFVSVIVVHGRKECHEIEAAIAGVELRWEIENDNG